MTDPSSVPFMHKKGPGPALHFYHANGFSNGVYEPLLDQLSHDYDVYALANRATWPKAGKPQHNNWHVFADDLISFIENNIGHKIIGVGHSLGASGTILAANKRPDLFKALVLIEPAMVNLSLYMAVRFLPRSWIKKSKLYQGTMRKADRFDSPEAYLNYIRKFKGYQLFPEETFSAFADHGIKQHKNGEYYLSFPKEWEAHNYTMPPYLMGLLKNLGSKGHNIPTVAIRGQKNDMFDDGLWHKWKKLQDNALFLHDDQFGHLLPLEGPDETYKLIKHGLYEVLNKHVM